MLVQVYKGQTLDQKSYLKDLVNIHYNRNDMVLEPGTFRVRGDVIEVFPKYDQFAVRIELFGDEVEAIYSFNVLTGERLQVFDEFWVYPARHFVTSRENLHRAMDDIRGELIPRLEQLREDGNLLEAQRLEQRTFYDLEMMSELGYCSGIENYSMHLEGRKPGERPSTLIDFFPDDFLMFADESHVSIPQIRGMYNGDRARKINLVEHGFRLPSAMDNRPMKFEEFDESINQLIYVSATPSDYELEKCGGVIVEQVLRPTGLLDPQIVLRPTEGQIDNLIGEVRKVVANNERVLITTLTKRMAEDLTDYLKGVNIRAEYMHSDIKTIERVSILRGLRMQEFDVLVGINLLREGLDLPEVSLVIVLDADKEGFLRSKSSLLQVSGRAARNVNGRVILYGDKITASMQNLIDETDRRLIIQSEYNKKNGITPKTIYKSVDEIKLTTAVADAKGEYIVEEKLNIDVSTLDGMETKEILERLKRKMQKCAKDLQFEQAAIFRDEIEKIEETIK
jgi:excinuclease ABC subunit B